MEHAIRFREDAAQVFRSLFDVNIYLLPDVVVILGIEENLWHQFSMRIPLHWTDHRV